MATVARLASAANQMGDADEMRSRLRDIIRVRSFSERESKLASGRTSSYYFDMKMTLSQPEGLFLIAELMLAEIAKEKCDYVGGLEMGAVPVLNAIALRSYERGDQIPLFWIRKEPKAHGTMKLLEGEHLDVLRGKSAVMVDDVTTTGGSVLKAIQEARRNDIVVNTVITVVDRLEGAAANLAEHAITLKALLDASDFRARR